MIGLRAVIFKPNLMLVILRLIASQCDQVTQAELARPICAELQCGLGIGTTIPRCEEIIPYVECSNDRASINTDLNIDLTAGTLRNVANCEKLHRGRWNRG